MDSATRLFRRRLEEWKQRFGLGAGELATILLAKELSADFAVLDEHAARQLATTLGVRVIGCVGILEMGQQQGLITDLRGTYERMLAHGIYIDRQILNAVSTPSIFRPLNEAVYFRAPFSLP